MGLKIENLTKTYGDFKALNHVSLEAENGKILGILGRNGVHWIFTRGERIVCECCS